MSVSHFYNQFLGRVGGGSVITPPITTEYIDLSGPVRIVGDGNSIWWGFLSETNAQVANPGAQMLTFPPFSLTGSTQENRSVPGQDTDAMLSDQASEIFPMFQTDRQNILVVCEITNQLAIPRGNGSFDSAQQAIDKIKTYCLNARTYAFSNNIKLRIMVVSPFHRDYDPVGSRTAAELTAELNQARSILAASWQTFCDGVIETVNDPLFSSVTAPGMHSDKTHLNDVGSRKLAELTVNAVKVLPKTQTQPGNVTPASPVFVPNDDLDTLTLTHALGNSALLISENNGAFVPYTTQINVGDVDRAAGYWKGKVSAATLRNESAVVSSPAFTKKFVAPPTGDTPFYVLNGQSNTGYPSLSGLHGFTAMSAQNQSLYAKTHQARTYRMRNAAREWEIFQTGVNSANNDGSYDAPNLMSSGITMYNNANPTKTPFLFHLGKGGIPLANPAESFSWYPFGSPTGYFDNEYRLMALDSAAKMKALNVTPDFRLSVWMQGETDAGNFGAANSYYNALVQHFTNERTYWQAAFTAQGWGTVPDYKKVIIKIRNSNGPYAAAVISAQQQYCDNPANNATLIEVDGINLNELHFQPNDVIEIGKLIYPYM